MDGYARKPIPEERIYRCLYSPQYSSSVHIGELPGRVDQDCRGVVLRRCHVRLPPSPRVRVRLSGGKSDEGATGPDTSDRFDHCVYRHVVCDQQTNGHQGLKKFTSYAYSGWLGWGGRSAVSRGYLSL
jgi:hypothetical protein